MQTNGYLKAVLTVIAVFLGVIALRPFFAPEVSAQAQGVSVLFSADVPSVSFYEPSSGSIWQYNANDGQLMRSFKVSKLGQPLAVQFSRKQ